MPDILKSRKDNEKYQDSIRGSRIQACFPVREAAKIMDGALFCVIRRIYKCIMQKNANKEIYQNVTTYICDDA